MILLKANIGDVIKIPQRVELISSSGKSWIRLDEPEIGYVIGIEKTKWPIVYKIFLRGNIWNAYENNFYLENDDGKVC